MAILSSLPEQAIINGFKGTVDFYLWLGIPVARSWPRSPGHHRAPAVEATWPAFTVAAQSWALLTPEVQAAWNAMAIGTGLSGRDLQVKAYLIGAYGYDSTPVP